MKPQTSTWFTWPWWWNSNKNRKILVINICCILNNQKAQFCYKRFEICTRKLCGKVSLLLWIADLRKKATVAVKPWQIIACFQFVIIVLFGKVSLLLWIVDLRKKATVTVKPFFNLLSFFLFWNCLYFISGTRWIIYDIVFCFFVWFVFV